MINTTGSGHAVAAAIALHTARQRIQGRINHTADRIAIAIRCDNRVRKVYRLSWQRLRIGEEAQRELIRSPRPLDIHRAEGRRGVDLVSPAVVHASDANRGAKIDQCHQIGHIYRAVEHLDITGG